MKNHKIFIVLTIITLLTTIIKIYASAEIKLTIQQTPAIMNILNNEKNKFHRANIFEIINRIDKTYTNLYENLLEGKKLTIFFDPAHGLLPNGRWQGGAATHRMSCTNL